MQKTVILNQNRDFLQLYRRGRKIVSPYMILYVRKNRRKYNRLGITVGKKVGCAVKRNRARRIIRQAYRETEHLLPTGIDLVIVALPAIDGIRSTQLRDYLAGNGLRRRGENREVSSGMADWRISENFPADTGCVPVLPHLFRLRQNRPAAVRRTAGRVPCRAAAAAL